MATGTSVKFDAGNHAVVVHGHWHICQVRRQPSCRGTFAWLGSHPSLATRKDATVEVVLATCHKCSSKLCLLFGTFGPTPLQQKQPRKNHNFGTTHRSRDLAVQKR